MALHHAHGLETDEGLAQRGLVFQATGELLRALHQWNSHVRTSIRLEDAPSLAEQYAKLEDVAIPALGRFVEESEGVVMVRRGFLVAAPAGGPFASDHVVARGLRGHLAMLEVRGQLVRDLLFVSDVPRLEALGDLPVPHANSRRRASREGRVLEMRVPEGVTRLDGAVGPGLRAHVV